MEQTGSRAFVGRYLVPSQSHGAGGQSNQLGSVAWIGLLMVTAREVRAAIKVEPFSYIELNGRQCTRKRNEKKRFAEKRFFQPFSSIDLNAKR